MAGGRCVEILADSGFCFGAILAVVSLFVTADRAFSEFRRDRLPLPPCVVDLPAAPSRADALLEVLERGDAWTFGEDTTGGKGAVCNPPPLVGEMRVL